MQVPPVRLLWTAIDGEAADDGGAVLLRGLRDAGLEVIRSGSCASPETIVTAVLQEDADILCLHGPPGDTPGGVDRILRLLREQGAQDTLVVVAGAVSDEDAAALLRLGVQEVFGQGVTPGIRVDALRRRVEQRGPR